MWHITHQQNIDRGRENLSIKAAKIWFYELQGIIQIPSYRPGNTKKVLPTAAKKIPIKLKNQSSHVLGILNFISYCIWFFFHFPLLWKVTGKRADRVTSLCHLSINQTGPAWGQTRPELRFRITVLGLWPWTSPLISLSNMFHIHTWGPGLDYPQGLTGTKMPWPEN